MNYHEKVRHDFENKSLAQLYEESPNVPFDVGLAEEISHEVTSCPFRVEMLGNPPTLREHLTSLKTRHARKEFLAHYNQRIRCGFASADQQTVGA